ncbi:MAG: comL [Burkholderiaceae bacterium]|nr:comL [Burkholderiaceae bacterium]
MPKKLLSLVALSLAVLLSGCSIFSEQIDETKSWSAQKLYSEARAEAQSGNYEKAVQYYEKLESRYPFGLYAQQSQMEIAYGYYRQGEQEQALAAIERFIKLHPNHPNVDYMYYLRGLANFNDRVGWLNYLSKEDLTERDPKAAQSAFDSFKLLVTKFPDSQYAPDAMLRMKYLLNALAQYEVHVANYYYRRGAYLAAANRAQQAVKKYPDTPATEEALLVMVRSYDRLGLSDLRDDADRVFRQNYPNSIYLKGGPKKDTPWWKIW